MGFLEDDQHLFIILFFDEQFLVDQGQFYIAFVLKKLQKEYERNGLKINLKKTVCGKGEDIILG